MINQSKIANMIKTKRDLYEVLSKDGKFTINFYLILFEF